MRCRPFDTITYVFDAETGRTGPVLGKCISWPPVPDATTVNPLAVIVRWLALAKCRIHGIPLRKTANHLYPTG